MTRRQVTLSIALLATMILCLALGAGAQGEPPAEVTSPPLQMADAATEAGRAQVAGRAEELLVEVLRSHDDLQVLHAVDESHSLPVKGLEEVAVQLSESPDRYAQALAVELLVSIDPTAHRQRFVTLLESRFRAIRVRALEALILQADAELIPVLGQVLENDPDPDLRALAAGGLAATRSSASSIPLRRALYDQSTVVQAAAVKALVELGELGVGRELLGRLRPGDQQGTIQLLRLLRLVPDQGLVAEIAPLLDDPSPFVRISAAAAVLAIRSADR